MDIPKTPDFVVIETAPDFMVLENELPAAEPVQPEPVVEPLVFDQPIADEEPSPQVIQPTEQRTYQPQPPARRRGLWRR